MLDPIAGVWVFGDYADYFRNRVTLQLIAKGKALASELGTRLAVVVLGNDVAQFAMEYCAHGADILLVGEHPELANYDVELFTDVAAAWVDAFKPEIFLAGATSFGREFFPRLAKRLHTGLSADCVSLEIDKDTGILIQTTPAFGGALLADIATPLSRPQMATVHPNVFSELKHDPFAVRDILYPTIPPLRNKRFELVGRRKERAAGRSLEDARVVIVGGKGVGSAAEFEKLFHLAELLEAEVGGTRPAVAAGWINEDRLIGQTGKSIKPRLLISIGTSGALQYVAGIHGAEYIIAINRDPAAPIFKLADLGIVADASQVIAMLIEELSRRP
jgi:electron transfer flavoprotein alpha subunit